MRVGLLYEGPAEQDKTAGDALFELFYEFCCNVFEASPLRLCTNNRLPVPLRLGIAASQASSNRFATWIACCSAGSAAKYAPLQIARKDSASKAFTFLDTLCTFLVGLSVRVVYRSIMIAW